MARLTKCPGQCQTNNLTYARSTKEKMKGKEKGDEQEEKGEG